MNNIFTLINWPSKNTELGQDHNAEKSVERGTMI